MANTGRAIEGQLGNLWLTGLVVLMLAPGLALGSQPNAPSANGHWAYQPVTQPAIPEVRDGSWPRTAIDRFVLAQIEKRASDFDNQPEPGLRRAGQAGWATLARRLHFDLVGLPPSAERLASFETDGSSEAIEQLVDELLASPHFGERWGRHWLDVARFGESVTLRGFIYREAWRYRDYVIEAFNADLPYDQFVQEQIAGDLMGGSSLEERQRRQIATTFLALGNTNFEEQDKKQLEMDVVDEQLDTIGKAVLAQTIGCARCHDHKFDPIPARDYYAMAGILKNAKLLEHANVSKWIEVPLALPPEDEARIAAHESEVAALEGRLNAAKERLKKAVPASGEGQASPSAKAVVPVSELPGVVVDSAQARPVGEWKHSQYSKNYIGDGYLHDLDQGKGAKTLTFTPELPRAGRYEVRLAYIHAPSRASNVPVTVFHADGETVLKVNQQDPPLIDGRFVSLGQFRFEANNFSHVLIATDGAKGYVTADAVQFLPADLTEAAPTADSKRREPAATEPIVAKIKSLEKDLKALRDRAPDRPMVMSVKEEAVIADLRVQIRGSVHRPGDEAPRGFLSVATHGPVSPAPKDESGRRELAQWLTSPANPLTARVMANRVWHWLFGAGLVRTTDNFGATGESPSNPELLDYLASRLINQGWSVKKLIREIVLSRTYQLAAAASPALVDADPENRLFARANRRRLDAECIRDAVLTVSGQLDLRAGGPTISAKANSDYGYRFDEPRRSVYVPVLRNALPDLFELFDFADPSMTTGERTVSTVAPQALYFMNHPFVMEQARRAARRALANGSDTPERVIWVYRSTLGRSPTPQEMALASEHVNAPGDPERKWEELVHALCASVEFRYLE